MATIKEVIQLALTDYTKYSFMCHVIENQKVSQYEIQKTLDFIESQLDGRFTLTNHLYDTVPEYAQLCGVEQDRHHFESDAPHAYRVKWWNEVIQLPEAQV